MTEPPIDRDPDHLYPEFRRRLATAFGELLWKGYIFKLHEGWRTVDRQQYLYGSSRPDVAVYGRKGPWLTDRDGIRRLSNHQGTGVVGTGRAADCYPVIKGVTTVESPDEYWKVFAEVAEKCGLSAGYRWKSKDSPHVELVK